MRLLYVSSLLPDDRPSSGFEIANRAIIDAYRRNGVKLVFAGFRRSGARPARPGEIDLGEIVLENAVASVFQKGDWLVSAVSRGLPVAAAKLTGLNSRSLAARLGEAGSVDGMILNSIQMPTAFPDLPNGAPSIFIAHNVEHRSAAENALTARSTLTRRLYAREARLVERAERRVCATASVVHTLSEEDRVGLGLEHDPRCIPLAMSVGHQAKPDDGLRTHDVGLIGTWSWAPNRVGLDWFVREVAPLLPSGIKVAIAGRFDGPPPDAQENVAFVGRVESAQDFVTASRVVALATRGGTGVQLKTLETFEEGMPAVATSQALRGIATLPDNVRVADGPAAFAAALVEMVELERSGRLPRADGGSFARAQKATLDGQIAKGLDILDRQALKPMGSTSAHRAKAVRSFPTAAVDGVSR